MGLFKDLFRRKAAAAATRPAEPAFIPPAQFRKQDFAFDAFQDLSADQAQRKVEQGEVQVLDVRFEYEYRSHHIPEATLIPLPQLPARFQELDAARPTLVVCEHGVRSLQACTFLSSQGFKTLYNLVGGMSGYKGIEERSQ